MLMFIGLGLMGKSPKNEFTGLEGEKKIMT